MNEVAVLCAPDRFEGIVGEIADALKMMRHLSGVLDPRTLRVENKYFEATVRFTHTADPDLRNTPADAYILFERPAAMPAEEAREGLVFVAAKVDTEDEEGKYDTGDWVLDYFVTVDELGEIVGTAPFARVEQKRVADEPPTDTDTQAMIDEIQDATVRRETVRMARLFDQLAEDEGVEALDGVFGQLEAFQNLLQQASEADRKNAAAVIALCLGRASGE